MRQKGLVIVRGGGDLATGVIDKLYRCGYRLLILETDHPSAIRREVSFCEAVYDGEKTVEGITAEKIEGPEERENVWARVRIPLLTDPNGNCIRELHPDAVVDAILAKKNLGTNRGMAPVTIGLGPGFTAGEDVDAVVETKRGHRLGRVIEKGCAIANTGVPGMIGGYGKERVIHSPAGGILTPLVRISDMVEKDQIIAMVGDTPVKASLTGVLRGIIREGYAVYPGMKIADIDPRKEERENCFTISDKARCIAGGVLEILLSKGVLPDEKSRELPGASEN